MTAVRDYFNYKCWVQFSNRIYSETITPDCIRDNGRRHHIGKVDKVVLGDDGKTYIEPEHSVNGLFIKAHKNGKDYLIPATDDGKDIIESMPFDILEYSEAKLKASETQIYRIVERKRSVNITPQQRGSFKEFVERWNPQEHTNPRSWTFLKLAFIASQYKPLNMCVCSQPGSGKGSNFTIGANITHDIVTIKKPTLAKLETLYYYNKVVLPDEVTSLGRQQIEAIEPFILGGSDGSPSQEKHSMAANSKMNHIDFTTRSTLFTYNRIQDLTEGSKFFDDVWTNVSAFRDRFPQVLIDGQITSEFPNYSVAQAYKIMEDNFKEMLSLAKELIYWTQNMHKHLHGWDRSKSLFKRRHMTNMESLFDTLDVMCDSQMEFDSWIEWLNNRKVAYEAMVKNGSV